MRSASLLVLVLVAVRSATAAPAYDATPLPPRTGWGCWTTARAQEQLAECGKTCIEMPQVADQRNIKSARLYTSCISFSFRSTATFTALGEPSSTYTWQGIDGLGTYYTCSELVVNGAPTDIAMELASQNSELVEFDSDPGFSWAVNVTTPVYGSWTCGEYDYANSGLSMELSGYGVNALLGASALIFGSTLVMALVAMSLLCLSGVLL